MTHETVFPFLKEKGTFETDVIFISGNNSEDEDNAATENEDDEDEEQVSFIQN